MSIVLYDHKEIHFSVMGEITNKPPLIILNGIMMSQASWKLFIPELIKDRQVVLLDFIDQGLSHKAIGETYNHQLQISSVIQVMKELAYKEFDLFGISYGGQVALQVAIQEPSLIRKLVVFNAAAYTTPWLRDIGKSWECVANTYNAESFYYVTIPSIYSNTFYTQNIGWMENRKDLLLEVFNKEFLDSMVRLIKSSESYDIRNQLSSITCPTLIVGSEQDYLTPPSETKALAETIPDSIYMEISNCGHASMYEKPETFVMLLNGFLTIDRTISVIG